MDNLYDILDTCLQDLESGVDLEAILARYPEHTDELRPILQASLGASRMAVLAPSAEVVRRNRVRLLQRAAQLRADRSTRAMLFPSFQRWAMAFALAALFFFSGTRLVRASSNAIPGDGLYTVKRSWEDVVLFFTFDSQARNALEVEYENERLTELHEIFVSGRSEKVDFSGVVMRENADGWWIDNIQVVVLSETRLPAQPIQIGMAVCVAGMTRSNGVVLAEQIQLLPADAPLPEVELEPYEVGTEAPRVTTTPQVVGTTPEAETETPEAPEIQGTPSGSEDSNINTNTGSNDGSSSLNDNGSNTNSNDDHGGSSGGSGGSGSDDGGSGK